MVDEQSRHAKGSAGGYLSAVQDGYIRRPSWRTKRSEEIVTDKNTWYDGAALYDALKKAFPDLPASATKIVITLEANEMPTVEVTSYLSPMVDGELDVKMFELRLKEPAICL